MTPLANRPRGFTLLEMLLVIFILSALTLTATAFVDNQDDQFRYEDTRRRLQAIRLATVGETAPVHAGQVLLAGYVVDNGVMPEKLNSLMDTKPASFADSGQLAPAFDPQPNAEGLNDGGETSLTASGETLDKGWVAGRLQTAPGSPNKFQDGWGTKTGVATPPLDPANDGWQWNPSVSGLTVSSLGKDGKDTSNGGGSSVYDADMPLSIDLNDWTAPLSSISVRIKAAADFSGSYLRVSLLVFRNDAGARWRRYTTTTNTVTCLDGTGDGQAGGAPCAASEAVLTFAPHAYTAPWNTRIPIGRHLLVLIQDTDDTVHNGSSDAPYTGASSTRVTQPIHCYASGCTTETLVLR